MKNKIVWVVGWFFWKKGYDGVGIDDIMVVVKFIRGGFYGYFKLKVDLFVYVIS